jgi:general secretion pathway protein B
MSFILDALKKSEVERQRQSLPGLMDSPTVLRRRGLPLWAILLGALLAINIVVLILVLMRNGRPAAASVPERRADPVAAADRPAPAADDHFSPLSGTPVYAPEIHVPAADQDPSGTAPMPLATPHVSAPTAVPRLLRRPDPVLVDQDAKADDEEVLPSINELSLTGSQALPELHLDVHVYATRPADRFVYINMRKYHEGNTLQEGPVLEHIRRDGAVLNYQGVRFILPRQS